MAVDRVVGRLGDGGWIGAGTERSGGVVMDIILVGGGEVGSGCGSNDGYGDSSGLLDGGMEDRGDDGGMQRGLLQNVFKTIKLWTLACGHLLRVLSAASASPQTWLNSGRV